MMSFVNVLFPLAMALSFAACDPESSARQESSNNPSQQDPSPLDEPKKGPEPKEPIEDPFEEEDVSEDSKLKDVASDTKRMLDVFNQSGHSPAKVQEWQDQMASETPVAGEEF